MQQVDTNWYLFCIYLLSRFYLIVAIIPVPPLESMYQYYRCELHRNSRIDLIDISFWFLNLPDFWFIFIQKSLSSKNNSIESKWLFKRFTHTQHLADTINYTNSHNLSTYIHYIINLVYRVSIIVMWCRIYNVAGIYLDQVYQYYTYTVYSVDYLFYKYLKKNSLVG